MQKDIVLIQSGMHLTDVYKNEQNLLRQALIVFRRNKVVISPQTMFYLSDENKRIFCHIWESLIMLCFTQGNSILLTRQKKYFKTDRIAMCPDVVAFSYRSI